MQNLSYAKQKASSLVQSGKAAVITASVVGGVALTALTFGIGAVAGASMGSIAATTAVIIEV